VGQKKEVMNKVELGTAWFGTEATEKWLGKEVMKQV
jgi:hypothetical protein